ncbi:hypothetical protein [Bartonella rattaustraliani]|uniref:hypothetical protein n=1 Tax=Bartonella rattaustraliani TaxID=481139 RepID=UPI00030B1D86|nr:hypothetical protein [Bartonella rattaustraliani]
MNVRSYLWEHAPHFVESDITPIHLADFNECRYYAFASGLTPPAGGKSISQDELVDILANSQLIRQIKQEAERRILALAPLWKQQNALADIYSLRARSDLDEAEQTRLTEAQALLKEIARLRSRSNEIEVSFLNGIAIDYGTDRAWKEDHV